MRNIRKSKNFNVPGEIEISQYAFTEILANALIHRDYFINFSVYINLFLTK